MAKPDTGMAIHAVKVVSYIFQRHVPLTSFASIQHVSRFMASSYDITALLTELRQGSETLDADDRLYAHVYDALREIAHRQLSRVNGSETINTTALVHEAYLKLVDQTQAEWNDRVHFFSVAAIAMRQILLNYARKKGVQKRGGGWLRVEFDQENLAPRERANVLLALDEALDRLSQANERLGRVVELRFFGGMTEKEIGHILGVSERTVARDWTKARAFLGYLLTTE